MSGSNSIPLQGVGQPGDYGTLGTAAANNVPGGRVASSSWTDKGGNFWLFGGAGVDAAGKYGGLNDLWEYNSSAKNWAWMSGSNTANAVGAYGTKGVAAVGNIPGSRFSASSWRDSAGDLWLFGGSGRDANGYNGLLNDLWEYSPTGSVWTWVSGSMPSNVQVGQTGTFTGQTGIYGTLGVAAATNVPGSRYGSASWTDGTGNLWLFGGDGYDSNGIEGFLNDLWEFSPGSAQWTWVAGSKTANAGGVYGIEGSPAAGNVPGGRENAISWIDATGNFWLFGGVASNASIFNDLWEFNPSTKQWTWVSGANTAGASGIYGTLGTAAATNVPGARYSALSWLDNSGNLWLFGGEVFNQSTYSQMNDLWKFNPTTKQWTWVSGSNVPGATGTYGTLGTAASANVPGARSASVGWTDGSGNLWLFGGNYTSNAVTVDFNDLWRYQP